MNYVLPIILVVLGVYFRMSPPQDMEGSLGIRLPLAKESRKNWIEAHKFGGIIFAISGVMAVAMTYIAQMFLEKDMIGLVSSLSTVVLIIIDSILINIHLKKFTDK